MPPDATTDPRRVAAQETIRRLDAEVSYLRQTLDAEIEARRPTIWLPGSWNGSGSFRPPSRMPLGTQIGPLRAMNPPFGNQNP